MLVRIYREYIETSGLRPGGYCSTCFYDSARSTNSTLVRIATFVSQKLSHFRQHAHTNTFYSVWIFGKFISWLHTVFFFHLTFHLFRTVRLFVIWIFRHIVVVSYSVFVCTFFFCFDKWILFINTLRYLLIIVRADEHWCLTIVVISRLYRAFYLHLSKHTITLQNYRKKPGELLSNWAWEKNKGELNEKVWAIYKRKFEETIT